MGFTKLDSGIVNSSIWSEPHHVRILWITMLAMADKTGFVACSQPGLIHAAHVSIQEFKEAIDILESPDEFSRTEENEGIRVRKQEGGWIILNYLKYRESTKKDYLREKQEKYRYKKECIDTVSIPSASASSSSSVLELNTKIYSNSGNSIFNLKSIEVMEPLAPAVEEQYQDWKQHCIEKGIEMTQIQCKKIRQHLRQSGADKAKFLVDRAIRAGSKSIWENKDDPAPEKKHRSLDEIEADLKARGEWK